MSTQNHVYDEQYDGGASEEKCCLCFPIDCGVKTLAVLGCFGFLGPLGAAGFIF